LLSKKKCGGLMQRALPPRVKIDARVSAAGVVEIGVSNITAVSIDTAAMNYFITVIE
jgi:hypothetical protein